jgi:SAM-dependent methyltransferase
MIESVWGTANMRDHSFTEMGYGAVSELKKLATIICWAEEIRCMGAGQPTSILELGCGTGSISGPLARLGFDVLGTDVDVASVAYAAERHRFTQARFQVLDLEDAAAFNVLPESDVVICSEVIQYLSDPETALHRMRSLVRRPGYLILTTPNACGPYALGSLGVLQMRSIVRAHLCRLGMLNSVSRLRDSFANQHTEVDRPSLNARLPRPRFLTADRLRDLVERAGFVIREWRSSDFISMLRTNQFIAGLDCMLADRLPNRYASGWYLKCC